MSAPEKKVAIRPSALTLVLILVILAIIGYSCVGSIRQMEQSGLLIDNPEEVRAAVPKIENLLMSQQKFASLSRIMPARFNKLTVGIAIELKGKTGPLAILWSASIRNLEKVSLGRVDKRDSQVGSGVLQDSFLRGGNLGTETDVGRRVVVL